MAEDGPAAGRRRGRAKAKQLAERLGLVEPVVVVPDSTVIGPLDLPPAEGEEGDAATPERRRDR